MGFKWLCSSFPWLHQLPTVELTSNYRSHSAKQQIVTLLLATLVLGLVLSTAVFFLNRFAKKQFFKYTIANDYFKMFAFSFLIVGTPPPPFFFFFGKSFIRVAQAGLESTDLCFLSARLLCRI